MITSLITSHITAALAIKDTRQQLQQELFQFKALQLLTLTRGRFCTIQCLTQDSQLTPFMRSITINLIRQTDTDGSLTIEQHITDGPADKPA